MDPASLALAAVIWHGSTEVAAGRAERGPWQQNESRYDYVDDPTVAIDPRGAVAVAWVDQKRKDVFFLNNGASVNVSRSPDTFSWLPRMAIDAKGTIFVLWQEIIFSGGSHGGDMLFARSGDGGNTFSEPLNLSSSAAGDGKGRINPKVWHNGSYDLVVGEDGTAYVAWTEYEGRLWVRRSRDGGRSFSEKMSVPTEKPARAPSLAVHGDAVYLAWTVGDDQSADVRVAKSVDSGATFDQPVIVHRSREYSDSPRLAVDAHGTLHLVYAEGRQIVHSRSNDGGATFERPRAVSEGNAGFPALGLDANGRLYVLWERFAEHPRLPRGLALAVSRDGGRTFEAGEVPGSAGAGWNGSSQGLLMRKLAVGKQGAVAIVNSSLKQNDASRVWLMRGLLNPG